MKKFSIGDIVYTKDSWYRRYPYVVKGYNDTGYFIQRKERSNCSLETPIEEVSYTNALSYDEANELLRLEKLAKLNQELEYHKKEVDLLKKSIANKDYLKEVVYK